jgi:hypothetical protein
MEVPVRRSLAVIAITLSAVLVACGGGGSSDKYSKADYVDAAMNEFTAKGAPISKTEATCFIGTVVDGIGVHQLNADGVTPKQFASAKTPATYMKDSATRKAVVAQVVKGDCFGLDKILVPALQQAFGTALPTKDAECLAKELVKGDEVRTAIANGILGISGGPSLSSLIQGQTVDAIKACSLNPLNLLRNGGTAGSTGN